MESFDEKLRRVLDETIEVVAYDARWPVMFAEERTHLLTCVPSSLLGRIEHFGSTAVPGLAAKPIVDMLVEVTSLSEARRVVPPILEAQGYDYFWRPLGNVDRPPYYAWFIKRGAQGERTHHIHMVEKDFEHWDRLHFRDYLILHPAVAHEYSTLKTRLACEHAEDRIRYTEEKGAFIRRITALAKSFFEGGEDDAASRSCRLQ